MYKKVSERVQVVVLLIKTIAFMTFSLPSPSSDLKVPSVVWGTPRKTIEIQRAETSAEAPKTDGTTAQDPFSLG